MTAHEYTYDELIKARHAAAVIVRRFGERFMPYFDLIEAEITKIDERESALSRAISTRSHPSRF